MRATIYEKHRQNLAKSSYLPEFIDSISFMLTIGQHDHPLLDMSLADARLCNLAHLKHSTFLELLNVDPSYKLMIVTNLQYNKDPFCGWIVNPQPYVNFLPDSVNLDVAGIKVYVAKSGPYSQLFVFMNFEEERDNEQRCRIIQFICSRLDSGRLPIHCRYQDFAKCPPVSQPELARDLGEFVQMCTREQTFCHRLNAKVALSPYDSCVYKYERPLRGGAIRHTNPNMWTLDYVRSHNESNGLVICPSTSKLFIQQHMGDTWNVLWSKKNFHENLRIRKNTSWVKYKLIRHIPQTWLRQRWDYVIIQSPDLLHSEDIQRCKIINTDEMWLVSYFWVDIAKVAALLRFPTTTHSLQYVEKHRHFAEPFRGNLFSMRVITRPEFCFEQMIIALRTVITTYPEDSTELVSFLLETEGGLTSDKLFEWEQRFVKFARGHKPNNKQVIDFPSYDDIPIIDAQPKDENCPICIETMKHPVKSIACRHWVCYNCLEQWNQTEATCPVCKAKIVHLVRNESKSSPAPIVYHVDVVNSIPFGAYLQNIILDWKFGHDAKFGQDASRILFVTRYSDRYPLIHTITKHSTLNKLRSISMATVDLANITYVNELDLFSHVVYLDVDVRIWQTKMFGHTWVLAFDQSLSYFMHRFRMEGICTETLSDLFVLECYYKSLTG